ncbi:helical backbone metal receptor [uncultured Ilyobacter sp.]|uniref:ABC transporter substrate-binding protein n=1 Tax=uncultured Ilyobacter sp. TaxID=544433 RepID=UPI0029F50D5C|nr:helical backbone metal receptor [uncultured Ilyobacter sp.]
MKNKILNLIFILFGLTSVASYSYINVQGINFYSKNEIENIGFQEADGILKIQNHKFILGDDYVESQGVRIDFQKITLKKNDEKYYNSFFIDGLKNTDLKNSKKLKNIISLSPGITEKIYDLKMEGALVGRTSFCRYPKEASKIESMGSLMEPNLEKVMSKRPQIVLMESHYNQNFVKKLKSIGIKYLVYQTPKGIEDVYNEYIEVSRAIGVPKRGVIVAADLKSRVASYHYKNKAIKNKPKVYFVVGAGNGEYTAGRKTFINDLINISGGRNIAGSREGWKYSLEELIVNDPDYIIGGTNNIKILKSSPEYKPLSAVKNVRLYEVDEHIFVLPGSRAIKEGIPQLMKIFNEQ